MFQKDAAGWRKFMYGCIVCQPAGESAASRSGNWTKSTSIRRSRCAGVVTSPLLQAIGSPASSRFGVMSWKR